MVIPKRETNLRIPEYTEGSSDTEVTEEINLTIATLADNGTILII